MPDSLRSPDGRPVNAVRGLLDYIAKLVDTYHPTHLACCWDNDWRPAWRVELIPSYKAHRVAGSGDSVVTEMASSASTSGETAPDDLAIQVPLIVATLDALGVAIVGKNGYEADDVIGTLAATSPMPTDVVTGDRDLFQLVDDERQVRILYIARGVGRHERVTNSVVRDKYGIDGRQYADFAALRGDPSDGLPGVNGIGEKTAATLLQRFETIAGLQAAVEDPDSNIAPSPRRKIREAADYLVAAPAVTAVARSIDLGPLDLTLPLTPADPDRLVAMSEQWNLESPIARLVEALTGLR